MFIRDDMAYKNKKKNKQHNSELRRQNSRKKHIRERERNLRRDFGDANDMETKKLIDLFRRL